MVGKPQIVLGNIQTFRWLSKIYLNSSRALLAKTLKTPLIIKIALLLFLFQVGHRSSGSFAHAAAFQFSSRYFLYRQTFLIYASKFIAQLSTQVDSRLRRDFDPESGSSCSGLVYTPMLCGHGKATRAGQTLTGFWSLQCCHSKNTHFVLVPVLVDFFLQETACDTHDPCTETKANQF